MAENKPSAINEENDLLDSLSAFRKALAIEYGAQTKFEILKHLAYLTPSNHAGKQNIIASIRYEAAVDALEALLWKERSEANKE